MVLLKVDFTKVTSELYECAKPGCHSRRIYRHHRGNEHYFLRRLNSNKAWVNDMWRRYKKFDPADITRVCGDHHEEVHEFLYDELCRWIESRRLYRPVSEWKKVQIEQAVTHLRTCTDTWLRYDTPGIKRRVLTTFP